MIYSYTGVIEGLEQRKAAIERALAALREVDFPATAKQITRDGVSEAPLGSRRKFTAAARKRMALAQKARWARIKGEIEPPTAPAPGPAKTKRRISPEGIQRIIAATKKRWRLKRAAAKLAEAAKAIPKKAIQKKVAVKKSAPARPSGALAEGAIPPQVESNAPELI